MGHGKETPRQKMIGMMYLVLTALLALNVSKDVLDAFVLVDKGLTRTTENFASKNEVIYREFGKKFAENEVKVRPWKEKADEVKRQSDELVAFIDTLKLEIVKTSEGRTPKSIVEGRVIGELIGKKQDTNVPAQIMINAGKANDLRASIESFRNYLLSMIPERDIGIRAAVETSLNTTNPPPKGGAVPTWQTENFQGIPLIGVLTLMSKMQADVRNAEADVITYLYNQIDAGSLPFNKLEATVIPNTNYVFRGNEYEARVFIAAFDTTQAPDIFIGNYRTVEREDGSVDYEMVGDYQTIEAEPGTGAGIYRVRAQSIGNQRWGGLIRLRAPDGSFISRPFQEQYQVAEPSLVVSPTKMNVFYIGVDNPVEISVPGTAPDQLSVSSSRNAPISRVSGTNFVVRPTAPGDAVISVSANIDGTTRNMGSKPFRVRRLPDPVGTVGGRDGGNIDKNILTAQAVVLAELRNFDFDARFNVTSFTVSVTERGFTRDERSTSMRITDAQKALIQNASRGTRVYFDDIVAVGPDGSERRLPTISFRIQ